MADWMIERRSDLLVADLHGDLMALEPQTGWVYGFNPTAAWVWKTLERPLRLSELCHGLAREYDVDESLCERELRSLIEEFRIEGLVDVSRE